MKRLVTIAAATAIAFSTAALAAANEVAVAENLASQMEKFYGQPIGAADNFLTSQYGISGPIKQSGSSYTYMVPASSPFCGELKVDLTGDTITSWQTITWQRSNDHQPGRACEEAFKQKLGSL